MSEQYNSAFTGQQIDEAIDKVRNQAPVLAGAAQTLTEAQKTQARTNIGAASSEEVSELKKSVSEGKALIASAVTDKGVETADDATFAVMAANITAIGATYLLADKPSTFGQMACLARIKQMRDIVYTPIASMPHINGARPAGTPQTGLPYSSVRLTDKFIGFNVSIETFMTALQNPDSVLYTKESDEYLAATWYGVNCSVFVSYAYNFDYHNATSIFADMEENVEVDVADMQLCDAANMSASSGGGHIVIISGIERNLNGDIKYVEITEANYGRVFATRMTYDSFIADYITDQGYKMYRNKKLYAINYERSKFVPLFDEPEETVVYSDIYTNLGDKATINTDEDIVLNPINTDGYTGIALYRDGVEVRSYDVVQNVALTGLEAGKYTAKLIPEAENASTSFIVTDVTASREGTRYSFSGTGGTPIRVVFKDEYGYTLHAVDLTDEDVKNGYKDISYTNTAISIICVPFKNEYGFVVAKFNYAGTTADGSLPDDYQQVKYLEMSGGQYIDTGVLASDYPDGITYNMKGNCAGLASSGSTNYFFGALSNGVRAGNVSIAASSNVASGYVLSLLCGTISDALRSAVFYLDEDFELSVTASSAVSDTTMYYNGAAASRINYVTTADMPSANIFLFACNGVATTRGYKGKCFSSTMAAADGTPIRNYVPCYRKADSEPGMYDTVEGKFYPNAGTGSFTVGPDVVAA